MTFKSITTNDGYISLDDLISMSGNGNGVIIHREVPTYRQGRVVSRVIERTFFVDGKRVNDPEEWLSLLSVELDNPSRVGSRGTNRSLI